MMSGLLLSRENELAEVDRLLDAARAGVAGVAALDGPAGIGKTALLQEIQARAAARGFVVLHAAGTALEVEYAFGLVRELFTSVVGGDRPSGHLFSGAATLAAVPLGLPASEVDPVASWGDQASAALHGLYWLTVNLAEHEPLLLVVDDAHWADEMSLRFLLYLARRLDEQAMVLVMAARPSETVGDRDVLGELVALPGVRFLHLSPLEESDVARLIMAVGARDADDEFVRSCHRASGGNPFLLHELLRALKSEGLTGTAADAPWVPHVTPRNVVRWASGRVKTMGEDVERLAAAFAVLGAAELSDAAQLAGLEDPAAAAAADALVAANLLRPGRPLDFVHPLMRAAVHDALPAAFRADMHGRAARVRADRWAPPGQIAAHLLASNPVGDGWTVDVLRAAARDSIASGAPAPAAIYLQRALEEPPARNLRAEVMLELAEAELLDGLPGATEHMGAALELSSDPRRRAQICLALGRAVFLTGDYPAAGEVFERGLAERGDADDDLALELRGWHVATSGGPPELRTVSGARMMALISDEAPGRTRTERMLLAHLAYEAARSGALPHRQVAWLARRSLAAGALLADPDAEAPYAAACYALLMAGELEAAIVGLNAVIEMSQRRGARIMFGWFSVLRGVARYLGGDLAEAVADFQSARETHAGGYARGLVETHAFLAICLLERDDLTGAADAIVLPGGPEAWSTQPTFRMYLFALARLQIAQGQLHEAFAALLQCEHLVRVTNYPNPAANLPWRAEAALVAARLGDRDRARRLIAEDTRLARAFGAPHALGPALRAAGLIEGGREACEWLAEAVSVLEGSGAKLELARALIELGAARRRAGNRRDARDPLRQGLDLATHCGASALGIRARQELVAAGARPRRHRVWGAEALTATELRVAQMAAKGMTNRQIAESLFITTKTVKAHLGHTFSKLDIASRTQLAAKLQ